MANRVKQPGETDDQCRKRIMDEATAQWNQRGSERLKLEWKEKATAMNQLVARQCNSTVHHCQHNLPIASLEPTNLVMDLEPFRMPDPATPHARLGPRGFGPCGIGDVNWALRQQIVEDADSSEPGFVRTYSAKWKERSGGIVASGKSMNASTQHLCCQEALGFCSKEILDWANYNHVLTQLRQYVANHRRLHLVKGKNHGPNLEYQHPLLVLQAPADELASELSQQCPKYLSSSM